jgi:hypothetical protein
MLLRLEPCQRSRTSSGRVQVRPKVQWGRRIKLRVRAVRTLHFGQRRQLTYSGSYTMSLYSKSAVTIPTTQVPTSWSAKGCITDTNGNRVLTLQGTSSTMTIATCLLSCEKLGSMYAGVENGNECYCGKILNGGSKLDESKCNVACKGGNASGCG